MSTPTVRAAELRTIRRRGAWALAAREMRRVLGLWTQTILPSIATAVLFLAVFGGALGGALHHVAGVPYVRFILPGLLVMTVAVQAFANSSTSLFQAKNEGYIEDLLTSPLCPSDIALAYPTGGLVRGWLAALAITLLAAPFAGSPRHPAVLAAALVVNGVVFSTLGLITGIWADTFDQHAFIANLVITPLALVGGVFYPADRLSEPWSTLTRLDPLYYVVDAARYGAAGTHESDVARSLFVAALLAGLGFVAARAVLASGWRLKP